jgi:hypothetical protein
MSIFNDFLPDNRKGRGAANEVLIQPVIPLPAVSWCPMDQILRPSIPIITTPGPDRATTIGDITLFDRVMPILGQPWNLAVEPFYLVAHDGPAPRWGIRFGISLLLPE